MDIPFVTITVNSYNCSRFIKDCIQSILNQTYKDFELIIIDDCSTDDSYKKAKKFEKIDKRVKIIKLNKNYGIGKAKNEGISISRGKYIVTVDADDMLTKNSIEIRLKAAIDNNVSFVHADAILFKGNLSLQEVYKLKSIKSIPRKWPRRLHCPNIYCIHSQSVLARRWIYEKYGLYDEDLKCKVDREMWLRLFGKKNIDKPKISSYFLDKVVAYYRWHSKQVTKKRQKDIDFSKKNEKLCEEKYLMRKKEINELNTRFL